LPSQSSSSEPSVNSGSLQRVDIVSRNDGLGLPKVTVQSEEIKSIIRHAPPLISMMVISVRRLHESPELTRVIREENRSVEMPSCNSNEFIVFNGKFCAWNLRRDDLTEQSDECVAHLAHLLG
jgi:hypothetical protein